MQLILVCHVRRLVSFREVNHGGSRVNGDGKFQDFAEVWVGANRSRALILMRYASTVGAALVKRWKYIGEAPRKATPTQVSARPDMAIAERAIRSGGK
jgi:hypothetical protein